MLTAFQEFYAASLPILMIVRPKSWSRNCWPGHATLPSEAAGRADSQPLAR